MRGFSFDDVLLLFSFSRFLCGLAVAFRALYKEFLVIRPYALALASTMLFTGCGAESGSLPSSQSMSPEKVASIATTIKTKYPDLSSELRDKVLNTVVQSIDNMVFVEGGQFDMGDLVGLVSTTKKMFVPGHVGKKRTSFVILAAMQMTILYIRLS